MADWSGLLPELVLEIAKGIRFHEDFVSFSNVCSSWQSATRDRNDSESLPSRYPSILAVDDNQQQCLIHLMDGTVRKVQLPKSKFPNSKFRCFSSTGGWIFLFEEDTIDPKLFHPLSRRQIDLPDFKSLPEMDLDDGFSANRAQVFRAHLSSDPTTENEQDVMVMINFGSSGWLAFCKIGDSKWTAVQEGWISRVQDICYYKGEAFTFDGCGEILACDLHSKKPEMLLVTESGLIGFEDIKNVGDDHILPPWDDNHQKILVVYHRSIHYPYPEEDLEKFSQKPIIFHVTQSFSLFECDLGTGEWSKVEDLGNKAVFVGLSSSFAIEASGCIKPNCIYFTDSMRNHDFTGKENVGKLDMGIYNLSDGSMDRCFHVPSLSLKNNPMWIEPPSF